MLGRCTLVVVGAIALALIAAACGDGSGGNSGDSDVTADGGGPDNELDPRILSISSWSTDFTKNSVSLGEFFSGGPPKDGIPSVDSPKFESIAEGDDDVVDREPVIAIEIDGIARAYPLAILTRHEIVNDVIGDTPVTVTFCPLCNSAIVFERELDGVVYEFGVSGVLRNSDLVMYDRQTESWWQQFTGEAVVGELTGSLLNIVPSSVASWADFKATYPDGEVLSQDTGFSINYGFNPYVDYDTDEQPFLFAGEIDPRLSPIERVVAVELNGATKAYPFTTLEDEGVVADTVGGESIVVFHRSGTASALAEGEIAEARDVGASGVFRPEAAGQTLTFTIDGDAIVDNETGSTWNVLGLATDGPLAGEQLEPVAHGDHFWFAWAAFNPDTDVFGG